MDKSGHSTHEILYGGEIVHLVVFSNVISATRTANQPGLTKDKTPQGDFENGISRPEISDAGEIVH